MRSLVAFLFCLAGPVYGQSLGTAGTIRGKVTDPSGAVVSGAVVTLSNDLTLYRREATASSSGEVQFTNIPPNVYHLEVNAAGFQHYHRDLTVRSVVPVSLEIALAIEEQRATVAVTSEAPLIETSPSAHADSDSALFSKLPTASIATGLSDIITLSTPAVVADSDGFFHSLGDHAQMALSIDDRPAVSFPHRSPECNSIHRSGLWWGAGRVWRQGVAGGTAATRSGLGQKTHGSFSSGYVRQPGCHYLRSDHHLQCSLAELGS